jgi:hypothetical protein
MKGRPSDEGHLLTAGTIDSANFACTVRRSSLPARKNVQKAYDNSRFIGCWF